MIRVCAWCKREGRPCLIGEKPPYPDTRITHGACDRHAVLLLPPDRHPAQQRRHAVKQSCRGMGQ